MTEPVARPGRARPPAGAPAGRRPPAWALPWAGGAAAFAAVAALLGTQMASGGDPALGTDAGVAVPPAPRQVLVRRIERRVVETVLVAGPAPTAAPPGAGAPSATPGAAAAAPAAPAPAPIVTRAS